VQLGLDRVSRLLTEVPAGDTGVFFENLAAKLPSAAYTEIIEQGACAAGNSRPEIPS
jgi:hypothetical protein